jgi:hypothetical protein
MAELNWNDVITNPQAYPDEMLLRDLGETGQRLVELRKHVVPRDLAAREVNTWRQRAEVYQAEKQALEGHLASFLTAPAQAAQANPPPANTNTFPDYNSDPILKPLSDRASQAYELATKQQQVLDNIQTMQRQLMQGLAQIPQVMRLEQLRQQDPTLNPVKLVEFAGEVARNPDLAIYHKAMTYDQAVAKAKEEGMKAGLEQAKQDMLMHPQVPFAPYGPPQSVALPQPQFETLEAAEAAILQDPEIISMFYNAGGATA